MVSGVHVRKFVGRWQIPQVQGSTEACVCLLLGEQRRKFLVVGIAMSFEQSETLLLGII